ncbi:MAG: response regulator transcription factor [Clostridiaceae bacterium]
MSRVLICEDESSIRTFTKVNLERGGFTVFEAETGEEALKIVNEEQPDVLLLDVMLPGIDGFEVLRRIRENSIKIGVIMLTAKGQDMDIISGLKGGADDYMVKPFNPVELMLRIQGIIRRISGQEEQKEERVIKSHSFELDNYSQTVTKKGVELVLTPKEFLMIKIFMENPGKAFTRDDLLNLVWSYEYDGDPKIVDVNVRRLRSKVEDDSSNPKYIETIWGTGYRWKKG